MATYRYTARSKTGERSDGIIEAADKRTALLQIERNGLVPISVKDAGAVLGEKSKDSRGKRKLFSLDLPGFRKARMKMGEVLLLTVELSDLLASGMTLGNALHTLSRRKTNSAQDTIVATLRDEIVQGASLSDALTKFPETFSPLYVSMVRAGEASGQLTEVLSRLSEHYERVQAAREKVMTALIYPSIVLGVGVLTMIFAMVFIVPRFMAIFEEMGSTLPLPTLILIGMSKLLIRYGWAILGILVAGAMMTRRALRTPNGKKWWHRIQLRLPVLKKIVTANAYAHFARTLSALLSNGVQVLPALAIVEDTVGNVVIAEEIKNARGRVSDGATISQPLAQGAIFPPLLTDMLAVGEESGDLSGALLHIAKRYDTELDRSVKIFTTVLEPFLMLFMAIMVGFIAISMLMAVFDMTSGLNV